MSIRTKVAEIKIDEETFYLSFTMASMHEYKERYKKSALADLSTMTANSIDEEILFNIFGVCLRREPKGEIVEKEFLEELNPLAVITEFTSEIIDVCFSAIPQQKGQKKTKE